MNVKEAEQLFFRAMLAGYATDALAQPIPGMPGYKLHSHTEGPYTLTDCYWTTKHSNQSYGETVITYDGQPIWHMRYGGAYPKFVIPFLKQVLESTYRLGHFCGGRGEYDECQVDQDDDSIIKIWYENTCDMSSSFTSFGGGESICTFEHGKKVIGHHAFQGRWLVKMKG